MSVKAKKQLEAKTDKAELPPQEAAPEVPPVEVNPSLSASPELGQIDTPVVVLKPKEASEPVTSASGARTSAATSPDRPQVHVAPNLLDLVTGRSVTPDEQQAAKEQHNLNEIVHQMLVIGLVISTALMLTGLALDFILGREVPTVVPDFGDVFTRVIALRPSGFLALGLLVLIATPILRVVGSIFAFLYERDWRYAGITGLVLGIVMVSLFLGKG